LELADVNNLFQKSAGFGSHIGWDAMHISRLFLLAWCRE